MAAEYSSIATQIVAENALVTFSNGERACRKGCIEHRSDSGVFTIKGANNCRATYRVWFGANVAVAPAADGGVLAPVSLVISESGEPLGNTVMTVTPAAIGDTFNISASTFISLPCGCCKTLAVRNISDGTAITVANANIIFKRVSRGG